MQELISDATKQECVKSSNICRGISSLRTLTSDLLRSSETLRVVFLGGNFVGNYRVQREVILM
ncbi:hypothetical protein H1P_60006 [Hyella patelloides LEGE 07179]|uniref:Uncharacterized protein n=1 Tax=Hyella patelloides LEGE 07179 TaxID=945734 RepID=A0A563W110_9CYAN|nr:hypothetical protein H1P_60006 [Hyella patelloides LEGE 07179]